MMGLRRSWRTAALVFWLMLASIGPAGGQAPEDRPAPPLDLAALAPLPQDFAVDRLGLCCGELLYLDEMAASVEREGFGDAGETRAFLEEAGWRQRYIAIYDLPGASEPTIVQQLTIAIDEYGSPAGAGEGYGFWRTGLAEQPGSSELGQSDQPIGDQSSAWSWSSRADDRTEQITVLMTEDRFGLELTLTSYSGEPPSLDDALAYASVLRAQVMDGADRDQPGLGWKALRVIDGLPRELTFPDNYLRLHGEDAIRSLETADELAVRTAEFGTVEHVYNVDFGLPNGGWYAVRLFALPSEAAADAFFDEIAASATEPDAPFGPIVRGAPTFGDESFVVAYDDVNPMDGETAVSGYTARVRSGTIYIRLLYDGPDDPPLDAVAWLVETQLACLASSDPCPPVLFTETTEPNAGG